MTLPVDEIFPALCDQLEHKQRVILQAPPGAGKSTRLPLLLLKSGQYTASKQIVILEPRRVAARQIAYFLATSLGQKIGQQVGLSMRGQNLVSKETVIRVVTDGVMVRLLQQSPELEGISLVIFDEFHERALQTDLALALTLDAQELNDEVKVLIMSATLDLKRLSTNLDAPIVESQGRQFPVDVNYYNASLIPTADEIVKVINLAVNEQSSSILVFLSGVGEIKRVQSLLEANLPSEILLYPLYGGLSIEEQVKAIEPVAEGRRKIVLATNIAQTSLTIDGVDVVVDAGTERTNAYHAKTGSEQLVTQAISIASATQRAGRAGRLRPGMCYRLGSKEVFERRRKHDIAEIERANLSQLLLELSLWGAKFDDMFWLTKPESVNLAIAEQGLIQLGYWQKVATGIKNTGLVAHFEEYGLGLRFSKMLALAKETNSATCLATGLLLSALLEQRKSYQSANLVESLEHLSARDWSALTTDSKRVAQRLGMAKIARTDIDVDGVATLLLWAYPDRIAKKQGKSWKMANGARVEFHNSQVEPKSELIIVAGLNNSDYGSFVQAYAEIEPALISENSPHLMVEAEVTEWSEKKQGPQRLQQTKIGELVLSEKPLPLTLTEQDWQNVWCSAVRQKGLSIFGQDEALTQFVNKVTIAKSHTIKSKLPELSMEILMNQLQEQENWLAPFVGSIRKLPALQKLNVSNMLLSLLDWESQQELASLCPDNYQTPAGNHRKISYLSDKPKLSVKLQEMFGEPASPAICNGNVAITIELLSPAQRPLQVTQDLANFWQNAYVEVKKEMKGRYPKHPWPDDPVNFTATTKTKRQLSK